MKPGRHGFTLVELLVVIAIIGVLIALLLPAVQMAREAARRATCSNHLKQIGLAALDHESAHGFLPSAGWGYVWVGDPDLGFGKSQCGGWVFSLLPYMEEIDVFNHTAGLPSGTKENAAAELCGMVVPTFNCPTRRSAKKYPTIWAGYRNVNNSLVDGDARTDYAANGGDYLGSQTTGPTSASDVESWYQSNRSWLDQMTGVCFPMSALRQKDITDGGSNTYFVGEKPMVEKYYETGQGPNDNQTMYSGYDWDVVRYAYKDSNGIPIRIMPDYQIPDDYYDSYLRYAFGSAHTTVCHFVFCDGSVHRISYNIDPRLHGRLANAHDGETIDKTAITN